MAFGDAVQLIIFDVDGTLVDSQNDIVEAQARAFRDHGLNPPTRRLALSVVGLSLREAFSVLAGADAPLDSLAEAYKDAWHVLRARPGYADVLYPGAQETLTYLAARSDVLLGIATGKSRNGVERLVAAQGWRDLFATVQTADTHPSKPDPSMIRAALDETGAAAADTSMIGDTSYDMAMAVAAGARPIGVGWGYHDRAVILAAGAEVIVESFDQLREDLARLPTEAA